MPLGPVELLMVKFPGSQFRGEIVPALASLVERGLIRIIDIAFASRDQDGVLSIIELTQLSEAEIELFDVLVSELTGMISEEDIMTLARELEPGSSAAMLLWEQPWAFEFAQSLRNANAEVVLRTPIPHEVIEIAAETAALLQAGDSQAFS